MRPKADMKKIRITMINIFNGRGGGEWLEMVIHALASWNIKTTVIQYIHERGGKW